MTEELSKLFILKKHQVSKLAKKIELPLYKLSEELINGISHGIGVLLSILFLVLTIIKAKGALAIVSVIIYGVSSILLYLMSTLYHSFKPNNAKRVFRILDHCSIFLLIAGTYTPVVLIKLPYPLNWIIFSLVWLIAVIGIVLNAIDLKKFSKLSIALYLVLGWCVIFVFRHLWLNVNHLGLLLTFIGGICYTLGAIIYGIGKRKKYFHSVFHVFCIVASIFFFLAIYLYIL